MVIIPLVLLFVLISCSNQDVEKLHSRKGLPDQESWGVNIILTNQGLMRAKVKSGYLKKYNAKDYIILDSNVTVDFFDKNEKHTSILTSNQAEVDQSSNNMIAKGNVIATSDSGIALFSEKLNWNAKEEKLQTKEKIMITTIDKDTLYGIGFESDSDLKNWTIINPSGITGKDF